MGNKHRVPMPMEQRAKQFMPFSALSGLEEAIHSKERIIMDKPELSEEIAAELNRQLLRIELGSMVSVVYFSHGEYKKIVGLVARNNQNERILQVVNTKIPFSDILELVYV